MGAYRSRITAGHLWCVVGAVVVACEAVAPPGQLLSHGVDRGLERAPWLVRAGVILIAAHLLNVLPEKVDPLAYIGNLR